MPPAMVIVNGEMMKNPVPYASQKVWGMHFKNSNIHVPDSNNKSA